MVTYALDASAVLRYLDGEAGSLRVAEIIKGNMAGRWNLIISAVNWGEVAGITSKRHGQPAMELALSRLVSFGLEVVPVTAERAVRAALVKLSRKIPYADAFSVEVAAEAEHILITADFDLKTATRNAKIEFLPQKQRH